MIVHMFTKAQQQYSVHTDDPIIHLEMRPESSWYGAHFVPMQQKKFSAKQDEMTLLRSAFRLTLVMVVI